MMVVIPEKIDNGTWTGGDGSVLLSVTEWYAIIGNDQSKADCRGKTYQHIE